MSFFIGMDTETCNGVMRDDKLDLRDSLVYDIGWQVVDRNGKVYEKRSFVVVEVFCGMPDIMAEAYYADKIPQYWEDILKGTRVLTSLYNIREALKADIEKYNVKYIFAHNARFDYNALNTTERYLTKSKYRYFIPYGIEIWDTMKMARTSVQKLDSYKQFCRDNDYITARGQCRVTAEVLYRYITNDNTFMEAHTGLQDVEIETEIMKYCFNFKKRGLQKFLFKRGE